MCFEISWLCPSTSGQVVVNLFYNSVTLVRILVLFKMFKTVLIFLLAALCFLCLLELSSAAPFSPEGKTPYPNELYSSINRKNMIKCVGFIDILTEQSGISFDFWPNGFANILSVYVARDLLKKQLWWYFVSSHSSLVNFLWRLVFENFVIIRASL